MAKADLTFLNTSQATINILEKRGLNLTQIAELLEVSKSFISRVKAGERSFTLQHIGHIGRKVDKDLPWLLFTTMIDPKSVKPENRKLYNMAKRLLEKTSPKRRKRSKAA